MSITSNYLPLNRVIWSVHTPLYTTTHTVLYHIHVLGSYMLLTRISTKTEKMKTHNLLSLPLLFAETKTTCGLCTQTLFMDLNASLHSCKQQHPFKRISSLITLFPKKANGSKYSQLFICTGFEGSRCSNSSSRRPVATAVERFLEGRCSNFRSHPVAADVESFYLSSRRKPHTQMTASRCIDDSQPTKFILTLYVPVVQSCYMAKLLKQAISTKL